MEFLAYDSHLSKLELENLNEIIEFRNNLIDFTAKSGQLNIAEFFSYFIEKI
jgi:hypothetical protein